MKITMMCFAATLAAVAGACTTENHGYSPYYGPSQGYAYPQGYHANSAVLCDPAFWLSVALRLPLWRG